jgi:hypothetical protein
VMTTCDVIAQGWQHRSVTWRGAREMSNDFNDPSPALYLNIKWETGLHRAERNYLAWERYWAARALGGMLARSREITEL